MRRFIGEVANDENWEHRHRLIKVKACTVRGALKRIVKKKNQDEGIYQISTRINGCELDQPIWDFFNGNMSSIFGLRL